MQKENEICDVAKGNDIDVLFLQEIDLKDYSGGLGAIPGYSTYTHEGDLKRVCAMVREGVFDCVTQVKISRERKGPQIWLELEKGDHKITIGSIYREWCNKQEEVV